MDHSNSAVRHLPLCVRALFICCLLFASPRLLHATLSESIDGFAILNYTGYIIAGDAAVNDPGYNRDAIRVRAAVDYSTDALKAESGHYRIEFRLKDSSNATVPILDQTGSPGSAYYIFDEVSVSPLGGLTEVYSAGLVPAEQLAVDSTYTVEVRLSRPTETFPPKYVFTGDVETVGPRAYYHWTNETSGDSAYNTLLVLSDADINRNYLVDTDTDKDTFTVDADFTLRRYDDFLEPVSGALLQVHFDCELIDSATAATIPLRNSRITSFISTFNYNNTNPKNPYVLNTTRTLHLEPADGVQLDPVNKTYEVRVSISYQDPSSATPLAFNERTTPAQRILHFNGELEFGDLVTTFTSIANNPAPSVITASYIQTTLSVDGGGGRVPGFPGYTYGNGSPLNVRLNSTGTAYLSSGSTALNGTAPDTATLNHVEFERVLPMSLNTGGARADLIVHLPEGFGWREDPNTKWIRDDLSISAQPLGTDFLPLQDVSFNGPFQVAEETKPVWMDVSKIVWFISEGLFQLDLSGGLEFVRANEFNLMDAKKPDLLNPAAADKKSNENYYRHVDAAAMATAVVRAGDNGEALLTSAWTFSAGQFTAHFPYDMSFAWAANGVMEVKDDLVDGSTSSLSGAANVNADYLRKCPDGGCGAGVPDGLFKLIPDGGVLTFTPDGGLAASGALTAVKDLEWGYVDALGDFAQRALQFAEGSILMSGTFLRNDQTPLADGNKPGVLMLTGFAPDQSFVERPGTPSYRRGFADYAGMNFRVGADADHNGHSILGGQPTGNYPLTGRSKYYVRKAGVTGIHEAVFGSFPESATIHGYPINFSNFGLSFLDNENEESRTEGFLTVKPPSDFDQEFEELKFTCNGALDSATVPSGTGSKVLTYWLADFDPLAIDFRRNAGDTCDPGIGFLVMGVQAYASHIDTPLAGTLGFESNGQIIPPAFGLEGVDSRLKLPNEVRIAGPADENYVLNPVTDAYYNHEAVPNAPATGFINIAGGLDVPFFENIQVHLQTSAQRDNNIAPIHLMGGWPTDGWETAPGDNYFTVSPFDTGHHGFPTAGTLDAYRKITGTDTATYRPRAKRTWLEVVNFNYPLEWSSSARRFKSWQPVSNNLLILNVEHQVLYLSPDNLEVSFGAQYDGLPRINLANLAFDAVDDATGVISSFADAGMAPIRRTIEVGTDRLDDLLEDQVDGMIDPIFDELVDPLVDDLYEELDDAYDAAPDVATFRTEANKYLDAYIDGTGPYFVGGTPYVKGVMNDIVGATASVDGVLGELDDALAKGERAIDAVIDTVNIDPDTGSVIPAVEGILSDNLDGRYSQATDLVLNLVGNLAAEYVDPLTEDLVGDTFEEIQPTIDEITRRLEDIRDVLSALRGKLNTEIRAELQARVSGLAGEVDMVSDQIRLDVNNFFATIDYSLASPFDEYSPEEIKQRLRQSVEDRFYGSAVVAELQTGIKQYLYDADAALREHLDSALGTCNQVMRDLISQSLAEVDKSINSALGDISDKMGAGQIDGYAHINGDSLRELRLDARFQWQIPDEMEFNAYLRIRELDSDGTDGCNFGGDPATEVTLGATDVSLDWISPDLRADANTKFTFGSGTLRGMAGAFEVTGGLEFETFEISYLGAAVAFGLDENYLSAACSLRFNKYEGAGGIYFGRTCTLDPIALWAPDVASVLGTPPFTGAYVYGEAWIPLNEAIGIPSTCLFNISAGVGAGVFYFGEGPTWGGNMLLGVSGEALCVVSIRGEIKLIGVKSGSSLRMKGSGSVRGKAGPCPFCIKFKKTVGLTYENGSWDVDL